MPKIRVLVVDDSVLMRAAISQALSGHAEIEVVGVSSNGRLAVDRLDHVQPDAVTLDVEMPEMDGIETLKAILKKRPQTAVIMLSSLTRRGAQVTLDALSRGAVDYIAKPEAVQGEDGLSVLAAELIPRIKAHCAKPVLSPPLPQSTHHALAHGSSTACAEVVAIGVSTGGPNALAEVLPSLPASFPAPVLVVQHMPPIFTRQLAERLDMRCALCVREAEASMAVEPGNVYIAPGGQHMEVRQDSSGQAVIHLHQGPPENGCRPAVDVLFRSLPSVYGARVAAVMMTGMGSDGLQGCRLIREAGGRVMAQDETTSVVWGMPGAVVHDGQADLLAPLHKLANEITGWTSHAERTIRA